MFTKTIPRFLPETRGLDITRALLSAQAAKIGNEHRLKLQLSNLTRTANTHLMPSARAGLYWLLRALKPPRLYLPAFLCPSIYECAVRAGIPLTYLDCEEGSFTTRFDGMNYESGSVLLLVHQYGIPADPYKARQVASRYGLILVEDGASGLGAKWNGQPICSFGDASIISFEYSKTISACKGGAIVYKDQRLAETVADVIEKEGASGWKYPKFSWMRDALKGITYELALSSTVYGSVTLPIFRARNGGYIDRSKTVNLGGAYPVIFGERRAWLATKMLQRLPVIIERRRLVFDIYRELLNCVKEITLPPLPVEADPVCTHFPLLLNNGNREDIVRKLWALGIDPGFNFSFLCGGKDVADATPVALGHTKCVLTLPISSRINDEMAVWIAKEIKNLLQKG